MANKITPDTPVVESEYTAEELARNAAVVFGEKTPPDCVTAALRIAGVEKISISAAKKIIEKFMTKEVK